MVPSEENMKKYRLYLAIFAVTFAASGAARADDKYIECIDPDIGKSCMECAQGGPQVCCPKHGTCTVNKLTSDAAPSPSACTAPESQDPISWIAPIPASEAPAQQS
jgi:hypothetical protein